MSSLFYGAVEPLPGDSGVKYSESHVQYILSSIDVHSEIHVDVAMDMRGALHAGRFDQYLELVQTSNPTRYCACELCHVPTMMTGTKRCNGCWELEKRLELRTLKMWAETPKGSETIRKLLQDMKQLWLP